MQLPAGFWALVEGSSQEMLFKSDQLGKTLSPYPPTTGEDLAALGNPSLPNNTKGF